MKLTPEEKELRSAVRHAEIRWRVDRWLAVAASVVCLIVGAMTPPRLAGFALVVGSGLLAWTFRNWKGDPTRQLLLLILRRIEGESDDAEPNAPPNSRPPLQLPKSPEVQTPDSLRTPSSGGCG